MSTAGPGVPNLKKVLGAGQHSEASSLVSSGKIFFLKRESFWDRGFLRAELALDTTGFTQHRMLAGYLGSMLLGQCWHYDQSAVQIKLMLTFGRKLDLTS